MPLLSTWPPEVRAETTMKSAVSALATMLLVPLRT